VSSKLDRRLLALADAAELAHGRLDAEHVAAARRVVQRAGERIGLGLESTIVALAGPTGAGKSSLFNALSGSELSSVGRRRPTTSASSAAVWGDDVPELLDWLQVPKRFRAENAGPAGLVLLDLPDFDSVERSHRVEVDRVLELVDLLVWVVDPQKYADSALHDAYLRPLARYADSTLVVLNQIDTLGDGGVPVLREDLRQLLRVDGLDHVPVLAVSARTGEGIESLRETVQKAVERRAAAVARLSADVADAAAALASETAEKSRAAIRKEDRDRLHAALAEAAGVPTVVRAVESAHRRRGTLAAGWPFARWVKRLRPDPLRRLRLPEQPAPDVRTSLPGPTAVQREQVAAATRALAHGAAAELPPPWPNVVRRAATAREEEVADKLDRAVAGADLKVGSPRWWRVVGLLQSLLAAAVLAGVVWLLALVVLAWLQLDDVVPLPEYRDIPIPTLLLLGGVAAGLLLAFVVRLVNGASARRRARAAGRSLRARVEEVADELVLKPVEAELDAHARLVELLASAH
jgi:GTP-binding protein EngB required for normal cell division